VFSIEIPEQYIKRLAQSGTEADSDNHIRVTAKLTHSITGEKVSNTNNAVVIKNQDFVKMRYIYIESKR
jgi:hypothetical protein